MSMCFALLSHRRGQKNVELKHNRSSPDKSIMAKLSLLDLLTNIIMFSYINPVSTAHIFYSILIIENDDKMVNHGILP